MTTTDATATTTTETKPYQVDENGKVVIEAIDYDAVKEFPEKDRKKLAAMHMMIRLHDQGLLPDVQYVKQRATTYFEADPSKHFLEHVRRACDEVCEAEMQRRSWHASWEEREKRYVAKLAEARIHTKPLLFDALSSLGVVTVTVEFNGSGDSGQIEEIKAVDAAGNEILLDQSNVVIKTVNGMDDSIEENSCTLLEAIDTACWDWLKETHGGWVNDDGAMGNFVLNVANRTVTLEFNERYEAYRTSTEEL